MKDTLTGEEIYHNISEENENTVELDLLFTPTDRSEISCGAYLKGAGCDFDMWAEVDTVFYYEDGIGDDEADSIVHIYPEFSVRQDTLSWKYGGYVQYGQDVGRLATVNTGLRFDYFRFTGNGYFSPRAGVKFHLTGDTDLNFAYGRHYQTPEWYQLAWHPDNRDLKHKYTDQFVTGIEHLFADDIRGSTGMKT